MNHLDINNNQPHELENPEGSHFSDMNKNQEGWSAWLATKTPEEFEAMSLKEILPILASFLPLPNR